MPLPNFTSIFRKTFRPMRNGVRLACRPGPNLFHDLVFLKSLLHDARFTRDDVHRSGESLVISLERDRWELGTEPLRTTQSQLSLTGVQRLAWQVAPRAKKGPLWLDSLYLGPSFFEHESGPFGLVLCGRAWRLTIYLNRDAFSCVLSDQVAVRFASARLSSEP